MATTQNTSRTTSLTGRVAAEKKQAGTVQASNREAKIRVAAAWTLAKTMLPNAPYEEQKKFASTQMGLSTKALKVALRQTAINAHYTRVAEQFSQVHKVDLNDLLENPSILTKEENAVASEFKSEPKNASNKVADDRKDAGPLPAEYPEPKRDEPAELDGSHAGEGRPANWTEGPGSKEASKKTACDEHCTGDCEHKKAAAAKKADDEGIQDNVDAPVDAPVEDATADADTAEADAADAEVAAGDAEADADVAGTETEEFDEEKADLEDAVEDLKSDIENLEDAVSEFNDNAEDITFDEQGAGDGEFDGDLFGDDTAPAEGSEGEELDLGGIFDEDAMADKVSSLNDEDEIIEADGDDFFEPSDASELESLLEQEEELSSPADMFNLEGVDDDPMARIFASAKQAGEEGVVEPGDIESHFETELSGDDRDAETDHDGDLFADILQGLEQPKRDDKRDTEPNLKEPQNKAAAQSKQRGVRTIRQTASKKDDMSLSKLASLLFPDDADFE